MRRFWWLALALFSCNDKPEASAAPSASATASAPTTATARAAEKRPFSVMPDLAVDEGGIHVGPEIVDLGQHDGAAKLEDLMGRVPIDGKQVTLRTLRRASIRDVGAMIAALGKHGAPTILLKMDGGRKDLPAEYAVTPEARVDKAEDCSLVASVLDDLSTAVWNVKGGVGKKARKGLSGPDMTATGKNVDDQLKGCGSKTAFFSAAPKLRWEDAFHIGALIKKSDPDGKIDTLVLLSEEPVAGRPVKLKQ